MRKDTDESTKLAKFPKPIKEFIVSLLKIHEPSIEYFDSWDEILEIVANLEN